MSTDTPHSPDSEPGRGAHAPQALAAGLLLLLIAALVLYSVWDLKIGQLRSIGTGLIPTLCATLLGAIGLLLVGRSVLTRDTALRRWPVREAACVLGGVLLFSATIGGADFGLFQLPAFGLCVAGPLAVIAASRADPHSRLGPAVVYAILLTTVAALVLKFVLRLPIAIAPWLLGY